MRADGSAPAAVLLDQLLDQTWPDPESSEFPDAWQTKLYYRLINAIELIADGYDPEPHEFNYLGDGLWEFTITNLRVTFYDTDGRGEPDTTWSGEDSGWGIGRVEYRLPDDFASSGVVRLGHVFAKTTQKTTDYDLKVARAVREEDLEHDRLNG